jgi:hypothetical protein
MQYFTTRRNRFTPNLFRTEKIDLGGNEELMTRGQKAGWAHPMF